VLQIEMWQHSQTCFCFPDVWRQQRTAERWLTADSGPATRCNLILLTNHWAVTNIYLVQHCRQIGSMPRCQIWRHTDNSLQQQ